jgi:hypothetical protein
VTLTVTLTVTVTVRVSELTKLMDKSEVLDAQPGNSALEMLMPSAPSQPGHVSQDVKGGPHPAVSSRRERQRMTFAHIQTGLT